MNTTNQKVYLAILYEADYENNGNQPFGVFSSRNKALEALQIFSNEIGYSLVENYDFEITEKIIDASDYLQKQIEMETEL